jgi:ribosomal protein S13
MQESSTNSPIYLCGKIFGPEQKVYASLLSIRGIGHRLATHIVYRVLGTTKVSTFDHIDVARLGTLLENLSVQVPGFLLNQRSRLQHHHDLEKELDVRAFGCKVWHRRNRTYKGLCIAVGRKTRGQRSNRRRNKKKAGPK